MENKKLDKFIKKLQVLLDEFDSILVSVAFLTPEGNISSRIELRDKPKEEKEKHD